jgi:hypothetical protein
MIYLKALARMTAVVAVVATGCGASQPSHGGGGNGKADGDGSSDGGVSCEMPVAALDDAQVMAKATALGNYLLATHEQTDAPTVAGTVEGDQRVFPNGLETPAGQFASITTASNGDTICVVTTKCGTPAACLNVGQHGLSYSPTVIDPRNGEVWFGNPHIDHLQGPVIPSDDAITIGTLTIDQMDAMEAVINTIIIGQPHF